MKLKAICEKTGLTKRTVRFYEAQDLIRPQKTYKNGREYRDYSQEDAELLLEISTLRRARFSIQEIKQMDSQPESTAEIFRTYLERIRQEAGDLTKILEAAERIVPVDLASPGDLAARMENAAAEMPLPAVDIRPRFRYIDELEQAAAGKRKPLKMTEQEKRQHQIAAGNAAMYAAFSVQNAPGNNMASGGKGGGIDIGNAQKIAAYNLLMNSRDE